MTSRKAPIALGSPGPWWSPTTVVCIFTRGLRAETRVSPGAAGAARTLRKVGKLAQLARAPGFGHRPGPLYFGELEGHPRRGSPGNAGLTPERQAPPIFPHPVAYRLLM